MQPVTHMLLQQLESTNDSTKTNSNGQNQVSSYTPFKDRVDDLV